MKQGLKEIIGRTVTGVVFAEANDDPRLRIFLAFNDGTSFEFHGRDFSCCAGVDDGRKILASIRGHGKVRWMFGELPLPAQVGTYTPPAAYGPGAGEAGEAQSLERAAWTAARNVIEAARRRST